MISNQDGWVIVGKPNCPWCDKAKALLDAKGIGYDYVDLSQRPDVKDWVLSVGIKTVPQVFHLGVRVGGYEQTEVYVRGHA